MYWAGVLETWRHESQEAVVVDLVTSMRSRRWWVELDAPRAVEATLFLQPDRGLYTLNVIDYQQELPNIPIHGVAVSVRLAGRSVRGVRVLPDGIPLGTVHADDDDPGAIVEEAFGSLGLAGLKLHIQVQRFYPDDPRLDPVYERLVAFERVLVIHVGTGPHTNAFTGLGRFAAVLARFPGLRAVICHMGAFEMRLALALLERFPHLHLDTTMAMTPVTTPYTGIDPAVVLNDDLLRHRDRIVFGSDFPNLPYPYEEERRGLWARDLPLDVYQRIFRENARRLFRLS